MIRCDNISAIKMESYIEKTLSTNLQGYKFTEAIQSTLRPSAIGWNWTQHAPQIPYIHTYIHTYINTYVANNGKSGEAMKRSLKTNGRDCMNMCTGPKSYVTGLTKEN
jgi:hypothetical protein